MKAKQVSLSIVLVLAALWASLGTTTYATGEDEMKTDFDKLWQNVDRLQNEQKYREAEAESHKILDLTKQKADHLAWAKALSRITALKMGLHSYEEAVKFLLEEAWPESPLARGLLYILAASTLHNYYNAYSWEITQREEIVTKQEFDLKQWTSQQIFTKINEFYAVAYGKREVLGKELVRDYSDYFQRNTYPDPVRATLHDFVVYQWASFLANSGTWPAKLEAELYKLDFASLAADSSTQPGIAEVDTAHPLLHALALLDELYRWHAHRDDLSNMLETQLERLRLLGQHFAKARHLTVRISQLELLYQHYKTIAWSAVALHEQALLLQPTDPVAAHAVATRGYNAFPKTRGGELCYQLLNQIEAPDFRLYIKSMDGLEKQSLQISHKNMGKLYLRAYKLAIDNLLGNDRYWLFEPQWNEYPRLVHETKPSVEWEVALENPGDYRLHTTYITPPLTENGYYLIAASAVAHFPKQSNRIDAVMYQVSPFVIITHQAKDAVEVQVLEGQTGLPKPGVEIQLHQLRNRLVAVPGLRAQTDADGRVKFSKLSERESYIPIARLGKVVLFDVNSFNLYQHDRTRSGGDFIYTDRSIYRPLQCIYYKIVAYNYLADYKVADNKSVTIKLYDPNGEELATENHTTNAFGTASGSFVIPAGRILGQYQLRTYEGAATIRVEEYKRPTFEVEIQPPHQEMRLNETASIKGKAKYYFGMPVTAGEVRWRVKRTTVWPYWYWWWYGQNLGAAEDYELAAGVATLNDAGEFELQFLPEADPDVENPKSVSFAFEVTADVTDEGGETRLASYRVSLGHCAVSANVAFNQVFYSVGTQVKATILRQDLNGNPRPGTGSYQLFKLEQPETTLSSVELPLNQAQQGATIPGDAQRPRWASEIGWEQRLFQWKDADAVAEGSLTHDQAGAALVTADSLAAGAYRIYYRTKDSFGISYETQREFMVIHQGMTLQVPILNLAVTNVVRVGESAELNLGSGFLNQTFWYELCRDGSVLVRERLTSVDGIIAKQIQVDEKLRGGFVVRVYLMHDYQVLEASQSIMVPYDNKELKLEFATFRDLLRPGQEETWKIKVSGPESEKVAVEVLAYMYDRSLDFFTPHSYPTVHSLFPTYQSAPAMRWQSGPSSGRTILSGLWYETADASSLTPDSFRYLDSYGIGGPGMRFGRAMLRAKSQSLREDADYSMAAADMEGEITNEIMMKAPAAPMASDARGETGGEAEAAPPEVKDSGAAPEAMPDVPMRSDFAETAFFQPHLLCDNDGTVTISFKTPDSVTAWNFYLHAVTKDLKSIVANKKVETRKDLMVRPYLPRFLREGDQAALKVVVNNAGEVDLAGNVFLKIIDPETEQDRSQEFKPDTLQRSWQAEAGKSATVSFALTAPQQLGQFAFKVVAQAGEISDGELRPLPVLPGRMHLSQSKFVTLKDEQTRTMMIADMVNASADPSLLNELLVVSVDGQLIYHVLRALPYLVQYPYECVEQTLNRFLSTGIVSGLYQEYPAIANAAKSFSSRSTPLEPWDAEDPNRRMALEETPWLVESRGGQSDLPLLNVLDQRIAKVQRDAALTTLKKAQLSNGAFPWWSGGPASPYMTLYLLSGFAKAMEFGVEVPESMPRNACKYLGDYFRDYYAKRWKKEECGAEFLTFLNYVLSCFPDKAYYKAGFSQQERTEMLDYTFARWKELSPHCKAMLAMTLHRMDRPGDAKLVLDSIMDSSITKEDQGTFWAPEDRGWLWYNDNIESHAMILRALLEVAPQDQRSDGLALWLFLNKKTNQWKSTRTTAEVLYSLVHYLKVHDAVAVREEAQVTLGAITETFVFDPNEYNEGKQRIVVIGDEVKLPEMAQATVSKTGKGFMFASMNWHYSTEKLPDEARGDFISVEREFFLRVNEAGQMVLKPIKEGAQLAIGDELEVHLSIRCKHPMEYMHLKDPRGAGFEPENPVSRHRWDLGIVWYEEIRDSGTNFFFENLPQGEYTFKYRVRAAMSGAFKVGPATLQSMYAPEFSAFSSGKVLKIEE